MAPARAYHCGVFVARLTLLLAVILTFLGLASVAGAYSGSGSGSSIVGSTGSGGSSGQINFYQLKNVNFGVAGSGMGVGTINPGSGAKRNLVYPGGFLNQLRDKYRSNNPKRGTKGAWRVATREVLSRSCGEPINRANPRPQCPLWWNTKDSSSGAKNSTWSEIHALNPNPSQGEGGLEGQIAGYNVRIWRENPRKRGWEMIFQRQVGVGRFSSEPPSVNESRRANLFWWYGGNTTSRNGELLRNGKKLGGSYSMPGGHRGMIGAGMIGNGQNPFARSNCRANLGAGINYDGQKMAKSKRSIVRAIRRGKTCYWEGEQMGPESFSYNRLGMNKIWGDIPRTRVPDRQFGPRSRKCFLGASCKGKKESLKFSWHIPTIGTGKQVTRFNFKLRGAPGLFYAVHINAIDSRERLVNMKRPQKYTWGTNEGYSQADQSGQFFKVYMSSPAPLGGPRTNQYWTDEIDYSSTLEGPELIQTREIAPYRVSLDDLEEGEGDADNIDSVNFPRESTFEHFTPQPQYSDPEVAASLPEDSGTVYDQRYLKYYDISEDLSNFAQSVPSDWPANPRAQQIGGPGPQMIQLRKALSIDPKNPETFNSVWEQRIAWLNPTLDNPCPVKVRFPYDSGTEWPAQPDKCQRLDESGENIFNAWDDLLMTESSWDAQRVLRLIDPGVAENQRGRVKNQLLRCNAGDDDSVLPIPSEQRPLNYNLLTSAQQEATPGSSNVTPGNKGIGDPEDTTYPDGPVSYRTCPNAVYPLIAGVSDPSEPQRAQGFIDIKPLPNDNQNPQRGAAFITMDTNDLSLVNSIDLYRRADNDQNGQFITGRSTFTRNDELQLNLCRQGVPQEVDGKNVRYRRGSGVNADIEQVPENFTADQDCRGYVLRFDLQQGQFTGSDYDQCLTREAQSVVRQRRFQRFANMNVSTASGTYGQDDRGAGKQRAYGDSFPAGRAPFVNKAPWELGSKDCWREERDKWIPGRWERKWIPPRKVGNQIIPGRWERKWIPGYWTYKRVNGYSMIGSWKVHSKPQRGWGKWNSGPGLTNGVYLVNADFPTTAPTGFRPNGGSPGGTSGPKISSSGGCPVLWGVPFIPETCWSLRASYEGHSNLIRASINRRDDEKLYQFVRVFGNQGVR